MALEFKKYEGGSATLNDLGTVKEAAGKGGKIALIRKNYNDSSKRVAVLITRKDGNSVVVSCSKQVSESLRNKQMNIAQLAGLSIVENEEGINFISMPATGALQEFNVDKMTTETVEVKADFLPEELIAF